MTGVRRMSAAEAAAQQYLRGEHTRHIRYAQLLERWPVLDEHWAQRIDRRRLAMRDTTPGAATFGR